MWASRGLALCFPHFSLNSPGQWAGGPRVPGQWQGQGRWGAFEGGCQTQSSGGERSQALRCFWGHKRGIRFPGFLLQRGEEEAARGWDISK